MYKLTDTPSTGSERRTRFSTACNANRTASRPVMRSGGVGAECDSVCAGLFERHAADSKRLR